MRGAVYSEVLRAPLIGLIGHIGPIVLFQGDTKMRSLVAISILILASGLIAIIKPTPSMSEQQPSIRPRARDVGLKIGVLSPGPLNALTDVNGVLVGHTTIVRGNDVRTGVTAILPHAGNLFR